MPTILHLLSPRNSGPSPGFPPTQAPSPSSKDEPSTTVVWIVCAVIGGIIVLGSVMVYALILWGKHRQYKRDKELHPYLTRDEIVKRRRKNQLEPLGDEELRRELMIRKSLATRSSSGSTALFSTISEAGDRPATGAGDAGRRDSQPAPPPPPAATTTITTTKTTTTAADEITQLDREIDAIGQQTDTPSGRLREDWKRWEAQERRKRSASNEQHPANAIPSASAAAAQTNTYYTTSSPDYAAGSYPSYSTHNNNNNNTRPATSYSYTHRHRSSSSSTNLAMARAVSAGGGGDVPVLQMPTPAKHRGHKRSVSFVSPGGSALTSSSGMGGRRLT
ncbi:hypothetical protein VTJ04DRAFT_5025 [Mycothermus thermophilus]|uniref:uncharacterized protein n=1 Tax=Humicola insolens TaxID=85995 RepID=UPI0037422D09